MSNETPMVWTSKGHVPADELDLRPEWDFATDAEGRLTGARVNVSYFHQGEFVRNDVYAYDTLSVTGEATASNIK